MEKTLADLEVKRNGLKTEIEKTEKLKNETRKKTEELGLREEKAKATPGLENSRVESLMST